VETGNLTITILDDLDLNIQCDAPAHQIETGWKFNSTLPLVYIAVGDTDPT